MSNLLEIVDLRVKVGERELLRGVNLTVPEGKVHLLLGPNGSGKTSLIMTIMGYPEYRICKGRILFNGEDITGLDITGRSRLGIGVAYQRPPTVAGVKLRQILDYICDPQNSEEMALCIKDFRMEALLDREINAGLSGGEIKRSELLQMLAIHPGLILLDEPDSGVDVESLELMGKMINRLFSADVTHPVKQRSGIIITHTAHMLKYVRVDKVHVMLDGRIGCSETPNLVFDTIGRCGYRECIRCINARRRKRANDDNDGKG
jgi:Fe-S cluster assembly ATP-binding protein